MRMWMIEPGLMCSRGDLCDTVTDVREWGLGGAMPVLQHCCHHDANYVRSYHLRGDEVGFAAFSRLTGALRGKSKLEG
jgi:hypothetical protein